MPKSRHPQTDGVSEIMNRTVENHLRFYCDYHQYNWDELLPAAEFAYNSADNDYVDTLPFEMDLGWNAKSPLSILSSKEDRNATLEEFKTNLEASLEGALYSYKISKSEHSSISSMKYKPHAYKVGDQLRLYETVFRGVYAKSQESNKLSSKRFSPFSITQVIGKNAVELDFPEQIKIRKVANVSHTVQFHEQLKDSRQPVRTRPEPARMIEGEK